MSNERIAISQVEEINFGPLDEEAKRVLGGFEILTQAQSALQEAEKSLKNSVKLFGIKRRFTLLQTMHDEGLGLCTKCNKLFPKDDLKLLFIQGASSSRHHESNALHDYKELHKICPNCYEHYRDISTQPGESDWLTAHRVRTIDNRFEINLHGNWTKLPEDTRNAVANGFIPFSIYERFGLTALFEFNGWPPVLSLNRKAIFKPSDSRE